MCEVSLTNIADTLELTYTISHNDTVFHSKTQVSLLKYLERLQKYCNCNNSCFILALVYIDRLLNARPDIVICQSTIHKLIITSIVIAIKYIEDFFYSNEYYAEVGGISLKELNYLEAEFLFSIRFCLEVPEQHSLYVGLM